MLRTDFFNYLLFSLEVDVICMIETWFKPRTDDKFCEVRSYNVVHHDRIYIL